MNKPGLLLVGARSGRPIDERFASQSSGQQPEAKLSLAGFEPYLTASDRSKAKPTKSIDRNKEKISSKRKNKIDLTRDLARIKTNRSKGTHTHTYKNTRFKNKSQINTHAQYSTKLKTHNGKMLLETLARLKIHDAQCMKSTKEAIACNCASAMGDEGERMGRR
jgi:hypothetical protein